MFSLDKAYLGIVPITETISNCACLAKREAVDASTSPKEHFRHLTQSHPVLKKYSPRLILALLIFCRVALLHLLKKIRLTGLTATG